MLIGQCLAIGVALHPGRGHAAALPCAQPRVLLLPRGMLILDMRKMGQFTTVYACSMSDDPAVVQLGMAKVVFLWAVRMQ